MNTAFRRAERQRLTPPETPQKIIGRCENCKEVLTDDYTIYTDFEGHLFCSDTCGLRFYEIEELKEEI